MDNSILWEAILKRIGFLLGTNQPKQTLHKLVLSLIPVQEQNDSSIYIMTDLEVRKIILRYEDEALLELWDEFTKDDFVETIQLKETTYENSNFVRNAA